MKFGRRLLITLAVLLPVPLAAATGLAIPLPATVERLAAKLVPFADPASVSGAQAFAPSSRGRIVETEDEVTLTNLLTANTTVQTKQATQRVVSEVLVSEPKLRRLSKARKVRVKTRDERIKKERNDVHGNRPVRAKTEQKAPKLKAKPPKPPKPPKEPRASTPEPPQELPAAPPKRLKEPKAAAPKPPRETKKA